MARKPYKIPKTFSSNMKRTLSMAERNLSLERHQLIPIDLIEFDPDNPRKLSITRQDILNGFNETDELYEKKLHEYNEILKPLASTIKKIGLLAPVQVFKKKDKYRLVHGECRCLGSMIAKQSEIKAFVCEKEPNEYEIKFLQLIENVFRKNLTLHEKLKNIEAVYIQYKNHVDKDVSLNSKFVMQTLCCSEAQARRIASVLNAPNFLMGLIKAGKIHNLKVAARIASTQDLTLRNQLIEESNKGLSIARMKKISNEIKKDSDIKSNKVGRKKTRINMGYTKNKKTVKDICKIILSQNRYISFKDTFKEINWDNFDDCTKAFKKLLHIMEKI